MKLDGELNIFFKVELCFTIERVQTRSDVVKQAQVAQTKMMCRRVQLGLYLFFSYKKTKKQKTKYLLAEHYCTINTCQVLILIGTL